MATHTITILASKRNSAHPDKSKMTLSDHGNTKVKPGDTVIWRNAASSVDCFAVLFNDARHTNLFKQVPAPVKTMKFKDQSQWKVRISSTATPGSIHKYAICWIQDGKVYVYDPKIQVNG
jgi:hypothetical protein